METKTVKIPNILRVKVALVGESQVGKTSLCHQLTSDGADFPKNYLMTHCLDLRVKSINIPDTNDCVEIYIADSSGRDIYAEMLSGEGWRNAAMVVAMYDVTREDTFGAVTKWVEMLTRSVRKKEDNSDANKRPLLPGVLLANKADLAERRTVSPKAGSDLAQQLGLMYFESSCKDFVGVEEPFYYLASEFHKMHEEAAEQMAHMG